ncbi:MAG TPA: 3-isopropylmalate dehydratase large subunit [Burkholderiales bacterium]|jgi:3-isopropylmalate/(R)-2-methylmalate dehydratase large subunit|nr:3-isopropylmalate dehydratase large subunit [Burkholderiales bacterium]
MDAAGAHAARTMLDKIWAEHVIVSQPGGEDLLYVDLNLVHEGGTFMAFDAMRAEGRHLRKPKLTLAVTDHYLPSLNRSAGTSAIPNPEIRNVVQWLAQNTREFGIEHIGPDDARQGITHVIAPELGLTQPGLLITCCDSHTATQGALGALAMPIGHSNQLRHVFSTQTLWQRKPRQMRITIDGEPGAHVTAKDIVLAIIARIGIGGAVGHAVEYCGSAIRAMSIEARLTICNMSIEAGARIGMIAPDETTYAYMRGRQYVPQGADWDRALEYWRTLASDDDARFDRELAIDASTLAPMVSWGTSPEDSLPITERVPDPAAVADPERRGRIERALKYMQLTPGTQLSSIAVNRVFIGSCTNARIEDLRTAAHVVKGRHVSVPSMVVPGSTAVKKQAEAEGLDRIFLAAGFEWRDASCSMCGGSNGDILPRGERSASTTNRNFEGRQGPGAMTHIMSPAMAAAAAVTGHLTDVRAL